MDEIDGTEESDFGLILDGADTTPVAQFLLAEGAADDIDLGPITFIGADGTDGAGPALRLLPTGYRIDPVDLLSDLPSTVIGESVFLTTGGVPGFENTSDAASADLGEPGDAALTAAAQAAFPTAGTTSDAAILEFTFSLAPGVSAGGISFDLIFGSEEFPEFADSLFVDIATVEVNGSNVALFDEDPARPLSIIDENLAAGNFQDNTGGAFRTEYDGFSSLLSVRAPLEPGENAIRIGIADTGDGILDSGLFIGNLQVVTSSVPGLFLNFDGTPEDDVLRGTAEATDFESFEGDDLISVGISGDLIATGPGSDTIVGGFDEVAGDRISDFSTADAVAVTDLGVEDLTLLRRDGETAVQFDKEGDGEVLGSMTLEGDFDRSGFIFALVSGAAVVTRGEPGAAIIGSAADEKITGTAISDVIRGEGGTDTVEAGGGNDRITLGRGDDSVDGSAGNDVIDGGSGRDTLFGGTGDDVIYGGGGLDAIDGGSGDDRIFDLSAPADIDAGSGDDRVETGTGNDSVRGDAGDDTILLGDGEDDADGGAGDDRLFGGEAEDRLVGGAGEDRLEGGAGDDALIGGDGDDRIFGGAGFDSILGGEGDDVIFDETDGARIDGGPGRDRIETGAFADTIFGGDDRDVILSGEGDDTVRAGDGDDVVEVGFGNDSVNGGAGDDVIRGETGDDILRGDLGDDRIVGGVGSDRISGGNGNDVIKGQDGADQVEGGQGDDRIFLGTGNDVARAGPGNDVIMAEQGDDVVFGESGDDRITGFRGDEAFFGGNGDDVLIGNLGDDTLEGGAGDDRLWGGPGRDVFVFSTPDFGNDRIVFDFTFFSDRIDFSGTDRIESVADLTLRQVGTSTVIEPVDGTGRLVVEATDQIIGNEAFVFLF